VNGVLEESNRLISRAEVLQQDLTTAESHHQRVELESEALREQLYAITVGQVSLQSEVCDLQRKAHQSSRDNTELLEEVVFMKKKLEEKNIEIGRMSGTRSELRDELAQLKNESEKVEGQLENQGLKQHLIAVMSSNSELREQALEMENQISSLHTERHAIQEELLLVQTDSERWRSQNIVTLQKWTEEKRKCDQQKQVLELEYNVRHEELEKVYQLILTSMKEELVCTTRRESTDSGIWNTTGSERRLNVSTPKEKKEGEVYVKDVPVMTRSDTPKTDEKVQVDTENTYNDVHMPLDTLAPLPIGKSELTEQDEGVITLVQDTTDHLSIIQMSRDLSPCLITETNTSCWVDKEQPVVSTDCQSISMTNMSSDQTLCMIITDRNRQVNNHVGLNSRKVGDAVDNGDRCVFRAEGKEKDGDDPESLLEDSGLGADLEQEEEEPSEDVWSEHSSYQMSEMEDCQPEDGSLVASHRWVRRDDYEERKGNDTMSEKKVEWAWPDVVGATAGPTEPTNQVCQEQNLTQFEIGIKVSDLEVPGTWTYIKPKAIEDWYVTYKPREENEDIYWIPSHTPGSMSRDQQLNC
jgi:hypothetical protein